MERNKDSIVLDNDSRLFNKVDEEYLTIREIEEQMLFVNPVDGEVYKLFEGKMIVVKDLEFHCWD